jgi:hypothetical protein
MWVTERLRNLSHSTRAFQHAQRAHSARWRLCRSARDRIERAIIVVLRRKPGRLRCTSPALGSSRIPSTISRSPGCRKTHATAARRIRIARGAGDARRCRLEGSRRPRGARCVRYFVAADRYRRRFDHTRAARIDARKRAGLERCVRINAPTRQRMYEPVPRCRGTVHDAPDARAIESNRLMLAAARVCVGSRDPPSQVPVFRGRV